MQITFEKEDIDLLSQSVIDKIIPLIRSIRAEIQETAQSLISVNELTKYLGVKRNWIYQKVHSREIPHFKVSGLLRFRRSEIESWLNASRQRG